MESDVASELIIKAEEFGAHVETDIMDDDTATMARLKKGITLEIKKYSDTMHIKKTSQKRCTNCNLLTHA